MFSQSTLNQLSKMKIIGTQYYQFLLKKFGMDVKHFDKLISNLYFVVSKDKNLFHKYCEEENINIDSELGNYLYEMFNNLCRYNEGGVFGLFKNKQAEWGAPRVNLCPKDVPTVSDIGTLEDEITIYRGMSKDEYDSKDFAQHWTTDINVATRFAAEIYSELPKGIIVKAIIRKLDVIHYDSSNGEKEIIPIIKKILEFDCID